MQRAGFQAQLSKAEKVSTGVEGLAQGLGRGECAKQGGLLGCSCKTTVIKHLTVGEVFLETGDIRNLGEIGKSQKQMAKKSMREQIREISVREGKR